MRLFTHKSELKQRGISEYLPKLRDYSRTQLEYEGGLPADEDAADHYTQYKRIVNALY